MSTLHHRLLDAAVERAADLVAPLHGAAILITGASGFLASNLLVFLQRCDDRYRLGLRLFATARRPASEVPLFGYLDEELRAQWTVAAVESTCLPEVPGLRIVHAASPGSPADYGRRPVETFHANTEGLLRLTSQAERGNVVQFIYLSSAEIYGQPDEASIPTPETYLGGGDPLACRSIYSESKRCTEALGACFAKRTGIPFLALRPWNIYGPGQRRDDGRVPMEFLRQAREDGTIVLLSNGRPRRAFCYVTDAVLQMVAAFGVPDRLCALNVGQGTEEITILDLAYACAAATGLPRSAVQCSPSASSPGLHRCVPDARKILRLIPGAAVFTPLGTGLAALREWTDHFANHARSTHR